MTMATDPNRYLKRKQRRLRRQRRIDSLNEAICERGHGDDFKALNLEFQNELQEKYPNIYWYFIYFCERMGNSIWKDWKEKGVDQVKKDLKEIFFRNKRKGNTELPWADLLIQLRTEEASRYLRERIHSIKTF